MKQVSRGVWEWAAAGDPRIRKKRTHVDCLAYCLIQYSTSIKKIATSCVVCARALSIQVLYSFMFFPPSTLLEPSRQTRPESEGQVPYQRFSFFWFGPFYLSIYLYILADTIGRWLGPSPRPLALFSAAGGTLQPLTMERTYLLPKE